MEIQHRKAGTQVRILGGLFFNLPFPYYTMKKIIFLIGYSTRKIGEFIKILRAHSITFLVDIRTIPKSRYQPNFNEEILKKKLIKNKIKYLHFKELGGLRKPIKNSINKSWVNNSFRGFADYMQTKEFKIALRKLIDMTKKDKIVLMCAEGNPFRCHRSLIADALIAKGVYAFDINSEKSLHEHKLTGFAKIKKGNVTYP